MLGLAFDPNFEPTGRFFVNYIGQNGGLGTQSVVESYTISSDADVADTTSPKPLLTLEDPEWNHNGGMLAFGPDNCLYIGTGDGGGEGDLHASPQCPNGNGQCLDTELGKILRIDVDHPDVGAPGNLVSAGVPHIWDYGLRNPWRFSFDRATGDLYIGDVGQDAWEEIDIEPQGVGLHNYGWRVTEGKHCATGAGSTSGSCTDHGVDFPYTDFTLPVYDYPHTDAPNSPGADSIIGGYVYRGANIPSLNGYYVYADFGSSLIWAVAWSGSDVCGPPIPMLYMANPTSFGEDADGELYVTSFSGGIARIDAR